MIALSSGFRFHTIAAHPQQDGLIGKANEIIDVLAYKLQNVSERFRRYLACLAGVPAEQVYKINSFIEIRAGREVIGHSGHLATSSSRRVSSGV
jgi:hypothetical protein